jgi:RNA polymerase sigma-70 factor (ECF subfamily)
MAAEGLTPDAGLVGRMAGGDEAALASLYDRHGKTLYGLAFRILGDRDDAEEVVMDAFTQAWRSAATYAAERGSVAAWLVMLARSRALDRLRARSRQARALTRAAQQESLTPAAAATSGALLAAESRERSERVKAALAALPEAQRVCIELGYYEGLTQSEIAARLAEPLGTVKTRMRLGLIKLREALQPELAESA